CKLVSGMSCLTLHIATTDRVSEYAAIDKRMSTPCLSRYYSLSRNFESVDVCVSCQSYCDSPVSISDDVYSRIMPFVTQRIGCEALALLRKLMFNTELSRFSTTELSAELSLGTNAVVVLAKQPSSTSLNDFDEVAIKQFTPLQPLQLEEEYFQQHANEIYISCMMEHENIVHVHRAVYHDRQLSLVMEYCAHDFFDIVSSGTLTIAEIEDFFYQMVNGVRFLHQSGIAHRDLKLDNFMITEEGILKIVDFGFACVTRAAGRVTPTLSQGLWGSEPYMAPEIFTGRMYDPEKADVWSLGIIYIACVTNRFPWEVAKEEDFYYAQYLIDPSSLSRIFPNPASVNIIKDARAKSGLKDRYQQALL
ncbi:hypothetical protein L0F63_005003, partial [Massospora cicadina]